MMELLAKPARPWALRLLPPFPAVASRVFTLVNRSDVTAIQIGATIKLDPTFTAEILRVANSAIFGGPREIKTVTLAVSRLGLERVKSIAMLISLNSMMKSAIRIDALRRFWEHSLVTAIVAEESARVSGVSVDSAYTAGLLHNLGSLGLMAAYPVEYARMLDVAKEFEFDLLQTERDLFEIDHCAAGAYLAQEWNFPDEIAAAIATHHDEPVPGERSIYSLVQVAWRLADILGYVAFPSDKAWAYDDLVASIPGGSRSWLSAGIDPAKQEVVSQLSKLRI